MNESEEEVEYKGKWWLFGKPDKVVNGTLVLKNTINSEYKCANLVLDEPLINLFEESIENGKKVLSFKSKVYSSEDNVKIFGTTVKGEKISLHKCVPTNDGVLSLEMFIGSEFVNEQGTFNAEKFNIEYDVLRDWFENVINLTITQRQGNSIDPELFEVQCFEKNRISNSVNIDGRNYCVDFVFPISAKWNAQSLNMEGNTHVILSTDEGRVNFVDALQISEYFRSFLSFATSGQANLKSFVSFFRGNKENSVIDNLQIKYIPCSKNIQRAEDGKLSIFMLFSYRDMLRDVTFSNAFENWVRLYKELELGFVNTLYSHSNDPIYIFMSLIPRIESYFRNRKEESKEEKDSKHIIDDSLYEEIKLQFLDVIHSSYTDEEKWKEDSEIWTSRFNFLNNLTLESVLGSVIEENKEIILKSKIMSENEIAPFIKTCKDTRNYYAHLDFKKKNNIAKGTQFTYMVEKLKLIFEILILKELGFKDDHIVEAINRAKLNAILPLS